MAKTSLKNINNLIRNSVKSSSTEERFLADLNKHIEMSEETREKTRTYKPSSLSCMRNMFYQMTGKTQDEPIRESTLIKINRGGSFVHDLYQESVISLCKSHDDYEFVDIEEYVKQKGLKRIEIIGKRGHETKCFHKLYNMSFMCDGILKIKDKYHIWEIKSETSFKFTKRKEVDPAHINQASCYSLAFGLNSVLFTYVCRDNYKDKAFILTVTPKMQQDIIDKISECDNHVSELKVPEKEEDEKICRYCSYAKQCCKDGD